MHVSANVQKFQRANVSQQTAQRSADGSPCSFITSQHVARATALMQCGIGAQNGRGEQGLLCIPARVVKRLGQAEGGVGWVRFDT